MAATLSGRPAEIGGSFRVHLHDTYTEQMTLEENRRVFRRGLERSLETITPLGKQVILVGAVPEPGFDVPTLVQLASLHDRSAQTTMSNQAGQKIPSHVDKVFRELADARSGVDYLPLWDAFCNEECRLIENGLPLYADDEHISRWAARNNVAQALGAFMNQREH